MAHPSKRRRSSSNIDVEGDVTPPKKPLNAEVVTSLNYPDRQVFNQVVLEIEIDMEIIEGSLDAKKAKDATKMEQINRQNEKRNKQKSDFRKYICALRNSGGGVLIIKMISSTDEGCNNKFHKIFDDLLKAYLFHDEKFHEVFRMHPLDNGVLLIFVQGSSKIVTNDTDTKWSFPKGTESVSAEECFNLFPLQKCKRPLVTSRWIRSNYLDSFPVEESESIQFKSYKNVTNVKNMKQKLKNDIRNYIPAFTKINGGGSIFFGIEEKKVKKNTLPNVIGLSKSLDYDDRSVEEYCADIMKSKMLWLAKDCKKLNANQIEKYFSIRFHTIGENRQVMEISVAKFEGIVFQTEEGPTTWGMEDDRVCKISLERWYTLMNKVAQEKQFEKSDAKDLLSRFNKMSISSSVSDPPNVYQISHSATDIRDTVFRMNKPMHMTPEPLVQHLKTKYGIKMERALEQLQRYKDFKRSRYIAILEENFSVLLKEDEEDVDNPIPIFCKECILLCDVFVVGPDKLPLLISYCNISENHVDCMSKCREHNRRIAKMLTLKLRTFIRGLTGILNHTINVSEEINDQLNEALHNEMLYPESSRAPGNIYAKEILLSFVQIVASIPSPAHNIVVGAFFDSSMKMKNLLTLEQYQILFKDFQDKNRLLVHGLPGTGKTELIKEAISKLSKKGFRREEILFVTEHMPLCDIMNKKSLCHTLTRYELNEMWKENYEALMKVKHCFVDDAQFLPTVQRSSLNWYSQLSSLMLSGKFWIFYGNHSYRQKPMIDSIFKYGHVFEKRNLSSIIRNTKKIAEFALKYVSDTDFEEAVQSIPHDVTGEKVRVIKRDLSTGQYKYEAFEHAIKECLKRFNPGNIAVLFNTVSEIPPSLLCHYSRFRKHVGEGLRHTGYDEPRFVNVPGYGNQLKIVNASRNEDKTAVVVDSIRRYTSLERLVVIVIGCAKPILGYSAFTRPIAKLIVIQHESTS